MIKDDTAIKAEKLSKIYRIGMENELHDSLVSTFLGYLKSPVKNYKKYRSLYRFDDIENIETSNANTERKDIIWALKDVSLEIKKGEAVGIIGRNGAGKTTLLKIISKITSPSYGRAEIRGRISSLLEVGTGFHPELTGRENVYLNGTILGMTKKEVDRKFDEIIEFSGIKKFIDTPVKRYSVGMKIRLGFSVAAYLEPEILVVDEVLAVGDFDFQKKCLNKMEDVGQQGRTVLFVSHNMQAITRLCSRAIMLENGRIKYDGSSTEVVSKYMTSGSGLTSSISWDRLEEAPGGNIARLRAIRIKDENDKEGEYFDIRKPIAIEMEYEVLESGYLLLPHHSLFNGEGQWIFTIVDTDPNWRRRTRPSGRYIGTAWIPGNFLSEGIVYVQSGLTTIEPKIEQFTERDIVSFQVVDSIDGDTARGDWGGPLQGAVRPLLKWNNHHIAFNQK
jgi:lipopolysaccharide transport system ATP-binding protein